MKRALTIAAALIHNPKILFLDEPTLGLDPQTRNHIWNYIKDLNKKEGMTVFFTTHYMDEAARHAQKVAIIDNGKIIAQDTPENLRQKTGKNNLEDAFLSLTGHHIREETLSPVDRLRARRKMRRWH